MPSAAQPAHATSKLGIRSAGRNAGVSDLGAEGVERRHRQRGVIKWRPASRRWGIPEPYAACRWARLLRINDLSVGELKALMEGTLSALQSEAVPSRNPFQYLEIGLQTAFNHPKAGALLWMIGLDALFVAQKEERFSARLCRLLGKDTRVFPEDLQAA
jgi:hypothetical protein